jgi:hypothetical protein
MPCVCVPCGAAVSAVAGVTAISNTTCYSTSAAMAAASVTGTSSTKRQLCRNNAWICVVTTKGNGAITGVIRTPLALSAGSPRGGCRK